MSYDPIKRYDLRPLIITFVVFVLIGLIGGMLIPTKIGTTISIMSSLFFYLVVPGYFLLINVKLDDLERLVMSTAVSLALIPLVLFNLNTFWVPISRAVVIGVILFVSA